MLMMHSVFIVAFLNGDAWRGMEMRKPNSSAGKAQRFDCCVGCHWHCDGVSTFGNFHDRVSLDSLLLYLGTVQRFPRNYGDATICFFWPILKVFAAIGYHGTGLEWKGIRRKLFD